MAITVAALNTAVLELLQKSSTYSGFYTSTKVLLAINEACDYIAVNQMLAPGGGWLDKIAYVNTLANAYQIDLATCLPAPITDMAMIRAVRYKVSNQYMDVAYDQAYETKQFETTSGITQYPTRYRLLGNVIYFNPPLADGGTSYLQLEYLAYPADVAGGGNLPFIDKCFFHYCKYHAAAVLVSSMGKPNKEWGDLWQMWFDKMLEMVHRRVNGPSYIKEFEG